MGSNPIRAIVELVTNSDDAYVDTPGSRKGKIRIEVEYHRGAPTEIRVKDRAKGMTPQEMETKLAMEGGRSSGFEFGEDKRGLLGRGAKDIVHFGPVTFESKAAGIHSKLELLYDTAPTRFAELTELGSTKKSDHGTTVSLLVQPRFNVPRFDNLKEQLIRHFALRPLLMANDEREVQLVDIGKDREEKLIYRLPKGRLLSSEEKLEINGYQGDYAEVTLYEAQETLDDRQPREYWRHSLLLKSGRAAYDIFEGKFRREPWSTYLGQLFGFVEVPGISRLIREYDDCVEQGRSPPASNPIRLVKRDRSGLVDRAEHPFIEGLWQALEAFLQPHLDRIRETAEESTASPLRADLQKRLHDVSQLLSKLLAEEEAEGAPENPGHLPPLGLTIIPPVRIVEPGRPGEVLVRFRANVDALLLDAPPVLVEIVEEDGNPRTEKIELTVRDGYFSKTFVLAPRAEGDLTELRFECFGQIETALVEWRHRPVEPVTQLQFEHSSYAIRDGGDRTLKLLAPWELALNGVAEPERQLTGSSDIFLTPGWTFGYDEDRQCAAYITRARGRGIGARAKLVASLGTAMAGCELTVSSGGTQGLRINLNEFDIAQRSWVSENGTLNINVKDPSIGRYLGAKRNGWPGQNELYFRTLLAEVICFTLSRYVIQQRPQSEKQPASQVFREQMKLMEKWLSRVHASLAPTSELSRSHAVSVGH
jgi:hypothetical protein